MRVEHGMFSQTAYLQYDTAIRRFNIVKTVALGDPLLFDPGVCPFFPPSGDLKPDSLRLPWWWILPLWRSCLESSRKPTPLMWVFHFVSVDLVS
jgi:hypothetical protein